ncbi:MAG: hypothetical protein FWG88_00795 [Oscillospiraceae bacterium]|nr:hypothetical protein [Oscillospiraceae bacterium]
MGKKTWKLALSSIFVALSVTVICIAGFIPTGQLGIVAFSSILVAAAVIEIGMLESICIYGASAILGMLLAADKFSPLIYIFFFGYYPIIKTLIERINNLFYRCFLKLLSFNLALFIFMLLFENLLMMPQIKNTNKWIVHVLTSGIFALFDYGYSKLIWFYIERVSKSLRKG